MDSDNNHRLEAQKWYHGLTTKDICSPLLKNVGDFLVRAIQKGSLVGITLHVRNDSDKKPVDSFVITTVGDEKRYALRAVLSNSASSPTFDSVPNLIKFYQSHDLPNGIKLKNGIARPKWLISNEAVFFEKSSALGAGNFGAVYRGLLHSRIPCAIKVLQSRDRDTVKSDVELEQENDARIAMIREADLMASYRHENIVKFLGFACFHPPLMLVLELCNGGSLDKHLRKHGSDCTNYEKMVYVLEAARGMNYLHRKNCIHRDLASRNCLIDSKGIIKISDFGLSVTLKTGPAMTERMSVIPLRWMAPECLQAKMEFSFKTDVWSFGVLIFEIFSNGLKPFLEIIGDDADRRIVKCIRKCQMPSAPEGSHSAVQQLMDMIWQKEPEKRPTFTALLKKVIEVLKHITPVPPKKFILNKIEDIRRESEPKLDLQDDCGERRSKSSKSSERKSSKSLYKKWKDRTVAVFPDTSRSDLDPRSSSCNLGVEEERTNPDHSTIRSDIRIRRDHSTKQHSTERKRIMIQYDDEDEDDASGYHVFMEHSPRDTISVEEDNGEVRDRKRLHSCKTPPIP